MVLHPRTPCSRTRVREVDSRPRSAPQNCRGHSSAITAVSSMLSRSATGDFPRPRRNQGPAPPEPLFVEHWSVRRERPRRASGYAAETGRRAPGQDLRVQLDAVVADRDRPVFSRNHRSSVGSTSNVSRDAPPRWDASGDESRHCAPDSGRRGPRRRRGPPCSKGAARPDLGADPADRGVVGGAVSRVRIAGRCGSARVFRHPARCDRRVLAHARLPVAAPGWPGRHPARADPGDDPARRIRQLRRRRPVGDSRAARGARVQRGAGRRLAGMSRTSSCSSDRELRARSSARSGHRYPTGSRPRCWP